MNRIKLPLALLAVCLLLPANAHCDEAAAQAAQKVYGKIQIVHAFPDYKVRVVDSFPDLKIHVVKAFADSPGKWQFVKSHPDFKIQFVRAGEDFKIQYVAAFPGPRK